MAKTIRQIADEIGVSKQAVQKRIAREPLYTRLHPYIDKKGNTKYISVVGVKLIKSAFEEQPTIDAGIDTPIDVSIDNNRHYENQCTHQYIDNLIKQIENKDQQLQKKDNQIDKLHQLLDQQQQLTLQSEKRINELQCLLDEPKPKKKWFWK